MVTISDKEEDTETTKHSKEISEDLPRLINDIEDSNTQLMGLVEGLREQVRNGKLDTNDGISLLDVKNQMMLSYLINTTYVIAKKCHGRSIEGDSAIDRLVEIRTVLERIRPLEQKLKYMMEKLVKTALTGVGDENDPTHFRANPDDMMEGSCSESEEGEETPGKKPEKKSGVYIPPKLTPMYYDEEETQASRKQKQLERAKKRALHSSVVEELREEYLDTPAEVSHSSNVKAMITKHQQHKTRYEEEYFTRLPTIKKDTHRTRHSMTVGNIGSHLTHFEDIQVLENEEAMGTRKSKRKSSSKPKRKKGFKRRKTH